MSLAFVISSFQTGTYSVSRPGSDTYTAGVRTVGAPTVFSADMSIQPVGRSIKALPEGRRAEEVRQIWSNTELRVQDRITIAGEVFEVFQLSAYSILSTFWRVLAARQVVGV